MSPREERFRLPKELQLAALAAVVLALSLFLPWYQKTLVVGGDLAQGNVSALGAFTFVEAAILLDLRRGRSSSCGRARARRGSTCPAATASRSCWPAAGPCS